jgi:nucleotide-binding universal stress UspA family protein
MAHAVLGGAREALEGHGVCVASRVHEGPVAVAIIEAVEVWRADLIVVGARGLGLVKEFLLGSVSQKVARYAPCSVLVVKRPVDTIRRVLVALDGSIHAETGVGFVAELAFPKDTEVHLSAVVEVHGVVLPHTESNREARAAALRMIAESEGAAAERMLAEVRTVLGTKGWAVNSAVHIGDAADQLLREIHEVDPDLVILGAKGCTATKRFVLGGVAHKVLKYAPCSVLLVRPWGALSHCRVLTWHAETRSRE